MLGFILKSVLKPVLKNEKPKIITGVVKTNCTIAKLSGLIFGSMILGSPKPIIGPIEIYSNGNESFKYDFNQYRDEDGVTEIPEDGTTKGLKLFYPNIPQMSFLKIPGNPIVFWLSNNIFKVFERQLSKPYESKSGLFCGDNLSFLRNWYEVCFSSIGLYYNSCSETSDLRFAWVPINKGGRRVRWYGEHNEVVLFYNDALNIRNTKNSMFRNEKFYFKRGLNWNRVGNNAFASRISLEGFVFEDSSPSAFFHSESKLLYGLALFNSKAFDRILKIFRGSIKVEKGHLDKSPFIYVENMLNDKLVLQNVNISKSDWDSRETSWDFLQSPLLNESPSLSNAYKLWEDEVTNDFFQLHTNEEELNRIFIDIYGLQDELTPDVALKDITILQDELDRNALDQIESIFREQGKEAVSLPIDKAEVISQFISYAIGVFMGRYRLDKPGLNIAHPNPTEEETASYEYNGHTINIDEDGIIPLMGKDCAFPDDALNRVTDLVHAIWGDETLTENINFIHNALGMSLHRWLTERFWNYHISGKMYKKKPIYWLFSSNARRPQNAAFKVLVYMHRMDRYTISKIQRNYLYPHQEYISGKIERLVANEANLSREDLKHLELLRKWEIECRDYNEVLKELAYKEIEFDLDDGVTENYKLFEGAVAVIK